MPQLPPFNFQALEGILRNQQIAQAEVLRYAASGRAVLTNQVTFLPEVSGFPTSTPPVAVNTTVFPQMRHIRSNGQVAVFFDISFGAGSTFGSDGAAFNEFILALPVEMSSSSGLIGRYLGEWTASRGAGQFKGWCQSYISAGSHGAEFHYSTDFVGGSTVLAGPVSSLPSAWTVGDRIRGALLYDAADGYTP